eukprot:XP_014041875.1 PREDICTED: A disintegrin and metalloproteinase with thrombospondin motifs 14-like [Salmo salar]
MAFALDCIYLLTCCSLSLIFLDHKHTVKSHEHLSGKLSEYGLIVPFSTDSHGRYISHVVSVSGAWASAATGESESEGADAGGGVGASSSPGPGKRRVARSAPETPSITSGTGKHLFFNVTVFGKELHLRLKANRRLVAPGAFVEWQEDFEEKAKERLHGDCVFTGDVSDMPEATVAISNCDGLEEGDKPDTQN